MSPEIPKVAVKPVLALRNKLEQVLRPHIGRRLAQDQIELFVNSLRFAFDPPVTRGAVPTSVQHMFAKKITRDSLRQLCWRLAANVHILKAGQPVYPWVRQDVEEWAAVQLRNCEAYRHPKFQDIRYRFQFTTLTGTAAGLQSTHSWTSKQCSYLASKIGFTRLSGRLPYQAPAQFVGFRLLALFNAESCSRGYLDFKEVYCPYALLSWNKTLIKARYKLDPPCPRDYTHPCHECVVGYSECPAAVHPATYTLQICDKCGEMQLHDPDNKKTIACIKCYSHELLRRRSE